MTTFQLLSSTLPPLSPYQQNLTSHVPHSPASPGTLSLKSNILYKTKSMLVRKRDSVTTEKIKILFYVQATLDKIDSKNSKYSYQKGDLFAVIEILENGWYKVVKINHQRIEDWQYEADTIKQKLIYWTF